MQLFLRRCLFVPAFALAVVCGLQLARGGPAVLWATIALLWLGGLGALADRGWGLFALLAGGLGAMGAAPWGVLPADVIFGGAGLVVFAALALCLKPLDAADRLATLAGFALAVALGGALAVPTLLDAQRFPPAYHCDIVDPPRVAISAEQVPGHPEIVVTLTNGGDRPLPFELPDGGTYISRMEQLIRVEAYDAERRPLDHVRSYGCGGVAFSPISTPRTLAPGASASFTLEGLPAFYPASEKLPRYSHAMVMNCEDAPRDGREIAAARPAWLRVVYDSRALERGWAFMDADPQRVRRAARVRAESALVRYRDLRDHAPLSWGFCPPRR